MPMPRLAVEFTVEQEHAPAPKRVPETCLEKQRLRTELRSSMDEIIGLVVRQLETIRVDPDDAKELFLERQIAYVRSRKDRILELYKAHIAGHNC